MSTVSSRNRKKALKTVKLEENVEKQTVLLKGVNGGLGSTNPYEQNV